MPPKTRNLQESEHFTECMVGLCKGLQGKKITHTGSENNEEELDDHIVENEAVPRDRRATH